MRFKFKRILKAFTRKPASTTIFCTKYVLLKLQIMNKELPTTLDSVERASLEFEELGQSLNILTGGLVRRNKPAKKTVLKAQAAAAAAASAAEGVSGDASAALPSDDGKMQEWNAVEALQAGTLASIRKVATDVSSLTAVSTSVFCVHLGKIKSLSPVSSKDSQTTIPENVTVSIHEPLHRLFVGSTHAICSLRFVEWPCLACKAYTASQSNTENMHVPSPNNTSRSCGPVRA